MIVTDALSESLLMALRALPRTGAVRADRLSIRGQRLERLRLVRRLGEARMIEAVRDRPKIVQVRGLPFPRALHAALHDKPHLKDVLKNHGLLVLGILSTSPEALSAAELARLANLHPNTAYPILRRLGRRAFLSKARGEYGLHEDAKDVARLGRLFLEHMQMPVQESYPTAFPVVQHYGRLVLEGPVALEGLPATGASYFQQRGADVLAKAHTHAIVVSGAPLSPRDAYKDFLAAKPPPRTRRAVESYMAKRSEHP